MRVLGEHGVVLGASMGGLLAARVLSEFYQRVSVVERDVLPSGADNRKGVPQDRHTHALLGRGAQVLDELFEGLLEDLAASGVPVARNLADLYFCMGGRPFYQGDYPLSVAWYQVSRPQLERRVRDRVRALAGVEIIERCDVVGLSASPGRDRITGARIVHRDGSRGEETLDADLVVDATGRGGRTPAWLPQLGYQPPNEDQLTVNIKYVSQRLRLLPGALGRVVLVLVGAKPGRATGLALLPYEGDVWLLTLVGYGGHHPPTERAEMLEFVRPTVPAHVFAAIRDAETVGELSTHRFPASLRRRYDRLRRFLAGLLVVGDALCSFNPAYGQGMTTAALQAGALRDTLAGGDHQMARRFFRATTKPIDLAWQMAIGNDLALPEVEGSPPLPFSVLMSYFDRLGRAAEHDPVVAAQFTRVVHMVDEPTTLFRPAVVRRMVTGNARRRPAERAVVTDLSPPTAGGVTP